VGKVSNPTNPKSPGVYAIKHIFRVEKVKLGKKPDLEA